MKINVFEGGRRMVRLLQIIICLACLAAATFFNSPHSNVTFETVYPDAPWKLAGSACNFGTDGYLDLDKLDLGNGDTVEGTLCFRALRSDQGLMLVPYAIPDPQHWVGEDETSETVRSYMTRRQGSFVLTSELRKDAASSSRADWWRQYRSTWWTSVLVATISTVSLWALSWALGWIVRGFAGIPTGSDFRLRPAVPASGE